MTRYRQGETAWPEVRSTASAARTANARVAPPSHTRRREAEARPAPELGGPALLRAAARPREVHLRTSSPSPCRRVRAPRRRLGLDRNQRSRPELLQRHLRLAARRSRRSRRRRSSTRRTRRRGSPTRTSSSRRTSSTRLRRAHDLHDAEAEGRGRAAPARRALPSPRYRLADALPVAAAADPGDRAEPGVEPEGRHAARSGRLSLTNPLATACLDGTSTATSNAYEQFLTALTQRLDAWKKIAKLSPEGRLDAALARPGRATPPTRRPRSPATRRYLKLAPADSRRPAARKALKQLEAHSRSRARAPHDDHR